MTQEFFLFNVFFLIFSIGVNIICLILLIQILKSEKVARPFLLSLLIYFLFLTIANYQQLGHNMLNFQEIANSPDQLRFYTTMFVFILTLAAPLYLIYEIEKIFFTGTKLVSKYHIFSIINFLLYLIFIIVISTTAVTNPNALIDFVLADYLFVIGLPLGLQLLFIVFTFLYVAIKSTGKYRIYSLLISLGWFLNYAMNTIVELTVAMPDIVVITLLIPKLIGMSMAAFGFYKLYALKRE